MTRASQKAKKARLTVFRCTKCKADSGPMVILVKKKSKSGKTIFVEEDGAAYYVKSDEKGKSPEKEPSAV
jgi:hypothetical protein